MFKRFGIAVLCLLMSAVFFGCTSRQTDGIKIAEAYINGFEKFYTQGNKYLEQGLQLQADYSFGWSAASISSMRYCIDCLLYLKGEGESLEGVVGGRLSDWDKIAAMNYTSPYPYFFEGIVFNVQGKDDYARKCYEKALINPAFSDKNDKVLMVLKTLSQKDLKYLKKKLEEVEDKIFKVYEPNTKPYPRCEMNYSDKYLRTLAKEALAASETDYRGALRHYEVALSANPFEGDNYVGCALMHFCLNDIDETYYYVNEGLFVDPEHEGLKKLADILNKEASE
ncbi:MAG TPA: hypothetical protein VHT96_14310 [Clostridia bacterium]|nr:hypothetical protein [Clostridia bacterium]